MASIFADVEVGPKIEVFALTKAYLDDPSLIKVNLSVGGKCCLPRSISCCLLMLCACVTFRCIAILIDLYDTNL